MTPVVSISIMKGSMFHSEAAALVNPVNCVGVCGAGLAKSFKHHFSANFLVYKKACDVGGVKVGKIHPITFHEISQELYRAIFNFPTKKHWKEESKLLYIESGMKSLVTKLRIHKIQSIAIPALGCGLGGLDWADVQPIIYGELIQSNLTINVEIYPPK